MNWYIAGLKQYAVFNGRAIRKEYWMFALFNIIFLIGAAMIDNLLGTTIGNIEVWFVLWPFRPVHPKALWRTKR